MKFVSYAQNGEDLVLWRALKDVENGFYIDVGAADPEVFSVTHAFYQRGWSGINIEPTATYFSQIETQRTRDTNLNVLIGDVPGTVRFYEFASLGLSTMSEEVAQRHIDAGLEYRTHSMPVRTLASVCQERGDQPIHFLKIDVEGAEREVLLGMDFSEYRPWIVVVEATEPMKQVSTRDHWEEIILNSGYLFAYYDGLNCYYVAPEHPNLVEILKVPPSIFDDYIRADEFEFREQAEAWRLRLLEMSRDATGWRQRILALTRDEETWKVELARQREQIVAQAEQVETQAERLVTERRRFDENHAAHLASHAAHEAAFGAEREQWAGQVGGLNRALEHREDEIKRLFAEIGEWRGHTDNAHGQLHQVLSSFSWRATIPLRSISARLPGLARGLRGVSRRHPTLRRAGIRTIRTAGRMLLLKSPFYANPAPAPAPAVTLLPAEPLPAELLPLEPPAPIPVEPPPTASPPVETAPEPPHVPHRHVAPRPKRWFFLGDTFEWLEAHPQLTGVGKVTAEIFLAALDSRHAEMPLPCALAPTEIGLASISMRDTVGYLAARVGLHRPAMTPEAAELDRLPPTIAFSPGPGDHVLFTGVVWTSSYADLFKRLVAHGVDFSLLVYDIIPVLSPEIVGEAFSEAFAAWLRVVLTHANCVFVSGATIRDQILRWAALSDISVSATVSVIEFGMNVPLLEATPTGTLRPGVRDDFVLCVGTIDQRKNQSMLCRVWQRLIDELGREAVPQLVLVGRDDLGLEDHEAAQPALARGDIVVLQAVSDGDLAQLYRKCRFTAFPSLSEGYGLPVSESLAFGKLCVASDLPVIREHAADLPWYFPPDDQEAAFALLHRAITDPAALQAARARIATDFRQRSWTSTFDTMAAQIERPVLDAPPEQLGRLFIPGIPAPEPVPAIALAQAWCTEDDPQVSILIVNWNAGRLTRACIQQIWANTSGVRYEIIVVDNGSDPADYRDLANLGRGVRLLPLGENRFFGEACNIAAEHARAPLLCLLNNDCFGQPGWLATLVAAIEADPSVGAAGPLFLFPDMTVQEAGGTIDQLGYPVRSGRGDELLINAELDYLQARSVDYISAAALVVRTDAYMRAGGFDLGYEPAYYEDVDLCFKLRAMGLTTRCCPSARAIHIEGAAANDDPAAEARRRALGDLNRGKFVSRWGGFLENRSDGELATIKRQIFVDVASAPAPDASLPTAALFTPYALTPGGGERFLLTTAAELARDHRVTIVTPHLYSQLRLQNIGQAFGIDLSRCRMQRLAEFMAGPSPDLMVVLGNHTYPSMSPPTPNAVYICQFPFPMSDLLPRVDRGYRAVIAYSDYARAHIFAGMSAFQMPRWPIEVVYPPVPQIGMDGMPQKPPKKPIVLTVGRFFIGGHNKRHDLMIEAFRRLLEIVDGEVEMHIVGSSTPAPQHMEYLERLMQSAEGLPVTFHVNALQETLEDLYRRATIYWHATGLGADLAPHPELAEHFGISLVEAMSAGCVPMAFNAGGPREIITAGVDGFLYASIDELVTLAADILHPDAAARREAVGRAAGERAKAFTPERFGQRMRQVLLAQ